MHLAFLTPRPSLTSSGLCQFQIHYSADTLVFQGRSLIGGITGFIRSTEGRESASNESKLPEITPRANTLDAMRDPYASSSIRVRRVFPKMEIIILAVNVHAEAPQGYPASD